MKQVGVAKLIWRPVGSEPVAADFEEEGASGWKDGAQAMRQATELQRASAQEGEPWIKVGETIYTPEQIRTLSSAEDEQVDKKDEGMPGDEPWE